MSYQVPQNLDLPLPTIIPLSAWSLACLGLSLSLPRTLQAAPPWLLRGDLGLKEDENKDQAGRQGRRTNIIQMGNSSMYA